MTDFTVVVLENAFASGVSITLDMLAAANSIAAHEGAPTLRWRVCSAHGGEVCLPSGLRIATIKLPTRYRVDTSQWIIPGVGVTQRSALEARLEADDAQIIVRALAKHVGAGGRVAASCSAVFLLHAARALAGRRVTTTWWLASFLQQIAPDCKVDANRMVCADGPIVTGGAAFAQTDVMLHLLRQRYGNKISDALARVLLIDARAAQAPFIVPEVLASGDHRVAELVARIESALPETVSVEALANEFCVSTRTLSRHVYRATGKSTKALMHSVKLRKAKTLLEVGRMSIEQVAAAVGYQDSTALRRMMKRVGGANPSAFRKATR